MPIYEFECRKCKAHIEVYQKLNDPPPRKCRKCGGRLEKLLSAPAIQFKGSGWYVTDYGSKGKQAKSETESSSSNDKKSEDTKDSSPPKKGKDKASSSTKPSNGD
jgi:putative FmdB family regulatory protein